MTGPRGRRDRLRQRAERLHALEEGPPSPCIGVCRLEERGEYCVGCLRTLEEIRDWMILPPEERYAVLRRIAARRAARA